MSGGYGCTNCQARFDETASSGICPRCRGGILERLAGPVAAAVPRASEPALPAITAPAAPPAPTPAGPVPVVGGKSGQDLPLMDLEAQQPTAGAPLELATPIAPAVAAGAPPTRPSRFHVFKPLIIGAVCALGFVGGRMLFDRWQHPSTSVAGTHVAAGLGLTIDFPKGWRHAEEFDVAEHMTAAQLAGGTTLTPEQAEQLGTAQVAAAAYFKGGSPTSPDDFIMLTTINMSSPELREAIASDFLGATNSGARGMVQSILKNSKATMAVRPCERTDAPKAGGATCPGTATIDGDDYALVLHCWPDGDGIAAALVMMRDAGHRAALDEIVASITR